MVTTYSHLSRFGEDIAPGTEVRQGQVIGFVGSTGLSTGPHLHYEVMVSDQFVDPMEVMEIYVPDGASVAAKVEKTTPSADEQAAIVAAERLAALQTRQSPAAKTSAALTAPPNQPSPKPVQSAEHTPRQRIAAAPTQHQTPVEPVPLPPIRLASLGTAEPAADVRQTRSDAPEPKTSATDKNASGRQAPAPRVTSSRISPLKAPQPPLVKMTKVEPGKAAEPRTGTLPKTEQQRRDAASKQNLRSGLVKAHQIAFARPNQHSKPEFRSPPRAVTPPALVPSLANLSASSGGAVERATASSPRTPDRTPAVLRPGSSGRTQTAGLAQPQAAAAEVEAARRRIEARLQAKERRLRVTLKSICTGC